MSLFESVDQFGIPVIEKMVLKDWSGYQKRVADAYLARPEFESEYIPSWNSLMQHIEKMFKQMQSKISIEFVDEDPYKDQKEISQDIEKNKRLKIFKGGTTHPVWTNEQNLMFRAYHDYLSHVAGDHSFGAKGEIASYNQHVKMAPTDARLALFTEIAGQAMTATQTGSFPAQKICKLWGFDYVNLGKIDEEEYKKNLEQVKESVDESAPSGYEFQIGKFDGDDDFDPDPSFQDFKIVAMDSKGRRVGYALIVHVGNKIQAYEVEVSKRHQRKGIATAMYDHAQELTGKKIEPYRDGDGEHMQTKSAKALWKHRGVELEAKGDWELEGYTFETEVDGNTLFIKAIKDGKKVAVMDVAPSEAEKGKLYPLGVKVDPEHRRKGLATEMYKIAEKHFGMKFTDGHYQSPEGKKFRKSHDKNEDVSASDGTLAQEFADKLKLVRSRHGWVTDSKLHKGKGYYSVDVHAVIGPERESTVWTVDIENGKFTWVDFSHSTPIGDSVDDAIDSIGIMIQDEAPAQVLRKKVESVGDAKQIGEVKIDPEAWISDPIEEVTRVFSDKGDGIWDDGKRWLAKKVDGKVAGAIRFSEYKSENDFKQVPSKTLSRIDSIFIAPEFRRKGIGKELLLQAIRTHGAVESNMSATPDGDALWKSIKGTPGIEVKYDDSSEDYGHVAWSLKGESTDPKYDASVKGAFDMLTKQKAWIPEEKVSWVTKDDLVFDKKRNLLSGYKYVKHEQFNDGWVVRYNRRSYRPFSVSWMSNEFLPAPNSGGARMHANTQDFKKEEDAEAYYQFRKHQLEGLDKSDVKEVSEMRTKDLKVGGKTVEAVLLAGGPGFKIYHASGVDGVILALGRKQFVVAESDPDFKTVMQYVNLKYQKLSDQEAIKQEFKKLIAPKAPVKEVHEMDPPWDGLAEGQKTYTSDEVASHLDSIAEPGEYLENQHADISQHDRWILKEIAISDLDFSQDRVASDDSQEIIDRYKGLKSEAPPIIVVPQEEGLLRIVDGFHRVAIADMKGHARIMAYMPAASDDGEDPELPVDESDIVEAAIDSERVNIDIGDTRGIIFVDSDDDAGEFEFHKTNGLFEIDFITVSPKYRGQGVAEVAIKKIAKEVRADGFTGIYADVIWGGSLKAFVNALGKPDHMSDDIRELSMEKALARLPKTQPEKEDGMYSAGDHISVRWDFHGSASEGRDLAEKYMDTVDARNGPTEVFVNPSRKEIREISQDFDSVRAFIDGDQLYVWNPTIALHQEIRDHFKLGKDALSLILYLHKGKVTDAQVTDNSKQSIWHHNPEVADFIFNSPALVGIKDSSMTVSYYDESIVGDWLELEAEEA